MMSRVRTRTHGSVGRRGLRPPLTRYDQGHLISHAVRIVPEYGVDGKVDGVLALGFDLSDRRQQQVVEANRKRVFEKMAHGDNLHIILEQVALYVESSKFGRHCGILLLNEGQEDLQFVAAP